MSNRPIPIGRRAFVRTTMGGLAVVGGLAAGCGNDVAVPAAIAATLDVDPASSTFGTIHADTTTMLMPVGAAITLRVANRPAAGALPFDVPVAILLIHRAEPPDAAEWVAVDSACPHAGCPLGYSARDQVIECPCHGSRFRAAADPSVRGSCAGDVVHLPAQQSAKPYAVTATDAGVVIDLRHPACAPASGVPTVANGMIALTVADFPELAAPGGVKVFNTVVGYPDPIAVVRVDATSLIALNAKCTHLCCTVAYTGTSWMCPCHGSAYATDGTLVSGPARFSLVRFETQFDGTTLTISNLAPETQNDCI